MSFVIEFPAGLTKKVRGIYRLNFGERYYIGRSICIHSRLINHQKNINNLLERTRIPSRFDYYRNIIKWIRFNKMETALRQQFFYCALTIHLMNWMAMKIFISDFIINSEIV